jgi:hypothetical protein
MGDDVPVYYVVSPMRRALVGLHACVTLPLGALMVGFALHRWHAYHRHGYGPDSVATPWPLYGIGAVGGVMLYAAVSSFRQGFKLAAGKAQLTSLSRTTRSFAISLISQVTLVSLYGLAVSEHLDIGGDDVDPTGSIVVIASFVRANSRLVASFVSALFAVEFLAIIVSVWERCIVRRAFEEEEAAEAADLEAVARLAFEPVSASAWNERLREKYGVDPLTQEYVAEDDVRQPLLDDD